MEIKEIRTLTGLSQTNFGKKYNIPVRTIQDWETEKRNPPAYVVELLEFRVRYDIEQEQIQYQYKTAECSENCCIQPFDSILESFNMELVIWISTAIYILLSLAPRYSFS